MNYYIDKDGRVRADNLKGKHPPLDIQRFGYNNSFQNKDEALYVRDSLRDKEPNIFKDEEELPPQPIIKRDTAPMKQDKFRERMRKELSSRMEDFWEAWDNLKGREKCDLFIKMLPYGFSKSPDEKPLDDVAQQKLILEETTRKATIIGAGIQQESTEEQYEEEDGD